MSEIMKIRLATRCEAAGRPENEDNFQVAEDLSISNTGFTKDKVFPLGSKGSLLLVCDGMGGMNAGEVASAIGVETIKNLFAPQLLTDEVLATDESICAYMKRAIVNADRCIKEEAEKDSAKHGMGSTAVMAWLLGQKVYVAWCGDSRCYRYNPATGLEQLSHDHSYVQDLVDTKQLSPELAFDHPNKNIITRSLGDPRGAARPDVKVYDLHVDDVILLCSDGLNDSLRDNEIEQAISRSLSSMESCIDALWNDSYKAGWHDNVTIVLAQVVGDNVTSTHTQSNSTVQSVQPKAISKTPVEIGKPKKFNWKVIATIAAVVILVLGCCVWLLKDKDGGNIFGKKAEIEQQKQQKQQKKYDKLYNDLKNVNFNGVSGDCIVQKVKEAKKNIEEFDKLGHQLSISDHSDRYKEVKDAYNNAIDDKILNELRRYSLDNIADQIQNEKL